MGVPGNANALLLTSAAGGGGYQVQRSIRLNSADSAYLSRTPGSAGNRKTFTWAGWVKRSELGTSQNLFSANGGSTYFSGIRLESTNDLRLFDFAGSFNFNLLTTQVFRDASAWYHILVAFDTTQSTASNRVKLYANGVQITNFATANYPSQNYDGFVNTTNGHTLGCSNSSGFAEGLNGYLAEVHFIDGQALDPSSFTETDATTGQLIPKAYSGSYGSNGWKLSFSDNSTAAALGTDSSSNGNTWTVNNLSVTAGSGNDSLVDTPTSYGTDTGVGGEVRGNYATLNPNMTRDSFITYSNGNLDFTQAASTGQAQQMSTQATIGVASGKWYWEVTKVSTDNIHPGVAVSMDVAGDVVPSAGYLFYQKDGTFSASGFTLPSSGASQTAGDVIGVALDADNRTVQFFKNGASQGTATNGPTGQTWFPSTAVWTSNASGGATCNFGQRAFAYTAPSGFKALCDTNLPAPVVAKPSTVMDVALWTGNGTSPRTISGLGFSPDFVWTKDRSIGGWSHCLYDVQRGNAVLHSNLTNAETATHPYGYVSAFNSDGFTLTAGASGNQQVNQSSATYVAWCWDAGTSTVTNTSGSISAQVRANASAGFSVVTWTGTGASASIGHGLGVAPTFAIIKRRDSAQDWYVTTTVISGLLDYLALNKTDASAWTGVSVPSSTVFNLGTGASNNASGATYVGYFFAPVSGYGNGFSYTGNGSTDGSFVYLGFRPRLILVKRTDTTGNWTLLDTAREGYNVDNDPLYPNLSDAEGTTDLLDITSNGFKLRSTDASVNANTGTYVGFAWAENPFQYARAR